MMKRAQKMVVGALALGLIWSMPGAASATSLDAQFSSAVSRVLNSIRSGQPALADMSNSEFNAFVKCAQGVMNGAPKADKEFVLSAKGLSAQTTRFNQVASKVPTERGIPPLKGRITQQCYM